MSAPAEITGWQSLCSQEKKTIFKSNNLSLLTTCASMDVTKSIPLERIDDRQKRPKIDTKSLFLLYHSGWQCFLLNHGQSKPRPAPFLIFKGGVSVEGGAEMLQNTALCSSDSKIQASDLTTYTAITAQGLLLPLGNNNACQHLRLKVCPPGCWLVSALL